MRFGLIGTGHWAQEVHAPALASSPDVEFVGVWGRNPQKAEHVASRFGGRTFNDPAALFADVEAVSFAVPPHIQAPLAIDAANAGCHLLLEKPIALRPAEADQLATAVSTNGVASIVFFKLRFIPGVHQWLTDVRSSEGWTGGFTTWLSSIYHPNGTYSDSAWRREWGALWDLGPHALSLILPVLGPVTEATAARGPKDTVHVVLRHQRGGSSTMVLSLTVPEKAAYRAVSFYGGPGHSAMPNADASDPVDLLRSAINALRQAIRTGLPHECGVDFGREVVHVLHGAQTDLT